MVFAQRNLKACRNREVDNAVQALPAVIFCCLQNDPSRQCRDLAVENLGEAVSPVRIPMASLTIRRSLNKFPKARHTTFVCKLVLHTDLNQHQMQVEMIQRLLYREVSL